MRRVLALAIVIAAAPAGPAAADTTVYRWIDTNGVVNYGNRPPSGVANVRRLDEDASRVSTVSAPSAEERARQREFLLEARIARLERELREPPPAPVMVVTAPAPVACTTCSPWGWWGVPVVGVPVWGPGWGPGRFPPPRWPGHVAPRPGPHPVSAPMRFPAAPPGRAALR
ncbi:MAG: DUF4124 domain-containing protein [Burkholderiales bacterium]|nr:DUF4124 domain-containing protein [Burkholderiales bacterium]